MRKTVLWQSPHVRVSLSALLALVVILVVAGCGGGGGGSNSGGNNGGGNNGGGNGGVPIGQNPTLPFLTGKVIDNTNTVPPTGVVGATVTLFGAGVPDFSTHVSSSDGTFTIANVDPRYTAFAVTSPDPTKWYNYALYNGKSYDTLNCRLPLPRLVAGSNSLPTPVVMSSASNNPPPPPPLNGCP